MEYSIYIGKKYMNIYELDSKSYVLFEGNNYLKTPFGIYDEINGKPFLDKLTRFLVSLGDIIESEAYIAFGLDKLYEENFSIFRIAFQKAGYYKNVIDAKKHLTFISTDGLFVDHDSFDNGGVVEDLKPTVKTIFTKKTNYSYGIYDAETNDVYEVIPKGTSLDDLVFNKKACLDYKYYVDVEQINNKYNRFILTIYEGEDERLLFEYSNKRLSGRYRVYFYIVDGFMCLDVFDLIRREWISSDDLRIERQFKMRK